MYGWMKTRKNELEPRIEGGRRSSVERILTVHAVDGVVVAIDGVVVAVDGVVVAV